MIAVGMAAVIAIVVDRAAGATLAFHRGGRSGAALRDRGPLRGDDPALSRTVTVARTSPLAAWVTPDPNPGATALLPAVEAADDATGSGDSR